MNEQDKILEAYEEILGERGPPQDMGRGKKGKPTGKYRVFLKTTVMVNADSFEDAEFMVLDTFESKKPKVKGMTIERFEVDGMDEEVKPKHKR